MTELLNIGGLGRSGSAVLELLLQRSGDSRALTLRRDKRYRKSMAPWRRLVDSLLAVPFALHHGYLRP